MKNIKSKIITVFAMLITVFAINNFSTAATTGSFSVSGGGSVNVGDSGSVTVTCSDCEGLFTVSSSNSSVIKVNTSSDWVTGSNSFSISAVGEGTATITVTASNVADNQATSEEVTGSKTVTYTVKSNEPQQEPQQQEPESQPEPAQAGPEGPSSNANLAMLGNTPNDFSGFNPGTTSYYTTVPNDVTSVSVYARTQDSNAKYSVSGNTNLDVGTNAVNVTVTAEDGTQKTYTIYVARKEKKDSEEVVPNVIDEKKGEDKKDDDEKLKVMSITIDEKSEINLEPAFKADVYKYTIKINDKDKKEKEKITTIPLKVVSNKEDAKIEIKGNEKLKDGENIIKITVTSSDGKEKLEYTITVRKNMQEEKKEEVPDDSNITRYSTPHQQYGWYIIGGIFLLFLIILIAIIVVGRRKKKAQKNNNIFEEESKIAEDTNISSQIDTNEENTDYEINDRKRGNKRGKHF